VTPSGGGTAGRGRCGASTRRAPAAWCSTARSRRREGRSSAGLDRRGGLLWSLPKGHVEPGETEAQTAVREVAEETGISGRVIGKLGTIDFWFVAEGRRVHKTVHHYLLLVTDPVHGLELSDADVEVSEVAWVPLDELPARLAYADERRLLDRVPALLADTA
jgi:8-oxo-dGTP pyrophosphatase MutT (NUDIX family)